MFESFEGILTWVAAGGGAGAVAYWLIERLPTEGWDPFWKRMFALSLTGLFAVGAFFAAVGMGYKPGCPDWRCWIEQIVATIGLAIPISQTVHGALKLERKQVQEG